MAEHKLPKMVKYLNDPCYGKKYVSNNEDCNSCIIRKSCETNFKAREKKEKFLKSGKPKPIPKEKKYKKTAKYKEWY